MLITEKIAYFFLVFTCLATPVKAQVLTLANIQDSILRAHPVMKMYQAEIRSMDEAAKGARSWMPPEFGAGFWMTPYSSRYWKADEMGSGMGSFMVSAQQMFPNKKSQEAEAKYMEAMSLVEKEKAQASLNDLFLEARKNFYEWIVIRKKLVIIGENEKLLDFMISNAEIRYRNGMGKISAYYKAKAALGDLLKMRLMLENEATLRRMTLNTLMNRDQQIDFQVDTGYILKQYPESFDSTIFISNRSDIKAVEKNIQLTYLRQDLERSKLKPTFGIRYDHMFAWAKQPWQFSLMGMAKIPIGRSTRMQKATIRSLDWKAESLNQEKQMIINEVSGMAYRMRNEILTKQKQIALFENNIIPALRNNYKTMQLGYEQNTEELFMLFDAWETLNMTQLDYLDMLQELLVLQAELDRVLETK